MIILACTLLMGALAACHATAAACCTAGPPRATGAEWAHAAHALAPDRTTGGVGSSGASGGRVGGISSAGGMGVTSGTVGVGGVTATGGVSGVGGTAGTISTGGAGGTRGPGGTGSSDAVGTTLLYIGGSALALYLVYLLWDVVRTGLRRW
ncbi:hypothetical protein [Streptomyces capparidis]